MMRIGASLVGCLATMVMAMASLGADGPPGVPADFKVQVGEFALKKEPVSNQEIVVHEGRAYVFASDSKEVLIVEPAGKRVVLVDVGRRVQSEVTFRSLDESLVKLKNDLRAGAEAREKEGGRNNLLRARMSRDLFEADLPVAEGPEAHRVRLVNPSVEVVADGEPEPDAARLASVGLALEVIAKLGAYRVPDDLPPFAELDAIAALTGERKLRPTELTYLYRLAGPPRKFRRAYNLVPTLTDREVEATHRVDKLRESLPTLRYGQYRPNR